MRSPRSGAYGSRWVRYRIRITRTLVTGANHPGGNAGGCDACRNRTGDDGARADDGVGADVRHDDAVGPDPRTGSDPHSPEDAGLVAHRNRWVVGAVDVAATGDVNTGSEHDVRTDLDQAKVARRPDVGVPAEAR